ncbi:MAG: metal-sulfur cluster assembly factor, partial [Nitrososphaerales archaeon]
MTDLKARVIEALKNCYDPEIPINIVDLGLIYDLKVEDGDVKIKMILTAPGCPMGFY